MAPQLEECPLPQEDGQIKPKHSKDLQNKITPAQENTTKAPTIEEPDATENHQTEDASHRIHSQTKLVKKNYGYYGRSNIMVQLMLDIIEYIVRTMTKHYAQVNLYQRKLQLKQKNKGRIVVVAEEDEDAHARSSSKSTSTNTSKKSKKRDDQQVHMDCLVHHQRCKVSKSKSKSQKDQQRIQINVPNTFIAITFELHIVLTKFYP